MNTAGTIPVSEIPMPSPNAVKPPLIAVTALIDGTEPCAEPFLAARVDDFEKTRSAAGTAIDITAQVYRCGKSPARKMIPGLISFGLMLGIPVSGFFVGGPVGAALGLLLDTTLLFTGMAEQSRNCIKSAIVHRKLLPDPDWKGKRTYEIAEDRTRGYDSKLIQSDEKTEAVSADSLAQLVAENRSRHPSSTTEVLYLGGHGLGYRLVAGMKAKDLGKALESAEAQSGKKLDLVVMESCHMGNLEALNELKDRVKVAVVSAEYVDAEKFPLKAMLSDAAKSGGTPEEMGRRMIEIAGRSGNICTLAAVNLEKLTPLIDSLDMLAGTLMKEVASGKRGELRAAHRKAMKYPGGFLYFMDRASINFSDLGSFLCALSERNLSPETGECIQKTKEALDAAIIAKTTTSRYRDGAGISFQSKPSGTLDITEGMGTYDELNMPESWKSLIKKVWSLRG